MEALNQCSCGSKKLVFTTVHEEDKDRGFWYPAWVVWCKGCGKLGASGSKSEAAWEWNNPSLNNILGGK